MLGGMRKLVVLLALVGCLISPRPAESSTQPKVLVVGLQPDEVARIRERAPSAKIVAVADREQAMREVGDADALVGVLDAELLAKGTRLRWVQVLSAGVDRYRFESLVQSDVVLTNAKVVQGPNVADHAMALLLVMTRGIHRTLAKRPERDWRGTRNELKNDHRPIELDGKLALVVGYGGIGAAIGQRAHGFGMRVAAVDPTVDKERPDYVESIVPPSQLREALGTADVVFNAVPLTEQTEKMFGAEELASMRDGAYLVNVGRGKTVDTDALVAALRSGKLAGAGLDVTDPEPLPADHPLWTLDNAVVTPHMGGTSDNVRARKMELVEDNVGRFVEGQPLVNVVDKAKGY